MSRCKNVIINLKIKIMKTENFISTNFKCFSREKAEKQFMEKVSPWNWEALLENLTTPEEAERISGFTELDGLLFLLIDDELNLAYSKSEQRLINSITFIYSRQYVNELINLDTIHCMYGFPQNKSPKDVFESPYYKHLIKDFIKEESYKIENVIKYQDEELLIHLDLAFIYLYKLDAQTFTNSNLIIKIPEVKIQLGRMNENEKNEKEYYEN